MQDNQGIENYIDVLLASIPTGVEINNWEKNAERYRLAVENSIYQGIVTDLDGVVLEGGFPNPYVLETLIGKVLTSRHGLRTPLAFATGRCIKEIKPFLDNIILNLGSAGQLLEPGNLVVFANNGAHGIDVITEQLIYSSPVDQDGLDEALQLDELKVLLEIRGLQLSVETESPLIKKRSIVRNTYTYTLGVNIPNLDLIASSSTGTDVIARFESLFGITRSLFYVTQAINRLLFQRGLPLEATTTGQTIDINTRGVNKGCAVNYLSEAINTGEDKIVSIGDSVFGNDMHITQRKSGFVNLPTIIPGNPYPIYIFEEGNQFERVATFLNKIHLPNSF